MRTQCKDSPTDMAVGALMMHCFAVWVFSRCAQTTPLSEQQVLCVPVPVLLLLLFL